MQVTLEELKAYAGRELEPSDWFEMDQARIDQFAQCTDDHQYIHVDPARMEATELGSTIAHGFLSLSLLSAHGPADWPQLEGVVMNLNYGLDRVRFMQPVRSGAEVRFRTRVLSITEKSAGRVLVKTERTLEIRGEEKPGMVAESLTMLITES